MRKGVNKLKEKTNFLDIRNQTETSADIYIYGAIRDDSWNWGWEDDPDVYPLEIKKQLDSVKGKNLTVYVNSDGGHVFAGVAIANMLKHHDGHTKAVVDGIAASIATQIVFSCDELEIPSNAYLMIHKPAGGAWGDANELRKTADALDVIQQGLISLYMENVHDGVTEETIIEMVNSETWLTGSQVAEIFKVNVTDPFEAVAYAGDLSHFKNVPAAIKNRVKPEKNKNEQKQREIDITLALI